MKKMKRVSVRNIVAMAVVGLGVAVSPGVAKAEFVDFSIDQTVAGSVGIIGPVDNITGLYNEVISFDGLGNFTATAYATFTAFSATEGVLPVFTDLSVIGDPDPLSYGLYALFSAQGTVVGNSLVGSSSSFTLYLDPNLNTRYVTDGLVCGSPGAPAPPLCADGSTPYVLDPTLAGADASDDIEVLTANLLVSGVGLLLPGVQGAFDLVFGDPTFSNGFFLGLAGLQLLATVDGDLNNFAFVGTQLVTGELSANFEPVPEPASLALLGMGLLGVVAVARRRSRKVVS